MRKIVKKYGNSLVVLFDSEDQKLYGIKEGSVIDLSEMVVVENIKDKIVGESK